MNSLLILALHDIVKRLIIIHLSYILRHLQVIKHIDCRVVIIIYKLILTHGT